MNNELSNQLEQFNELTRRPPVLSYLLQVSECGENDDISGTPPKRVQRSEEQLCVVTVISNETVISNDILTSGRLRVPFLSKK